jgi:hypothetical protein
MLVQQRQHQEEDQGKEQGTPDLKKLMSHVWNWLQ